MKAVLNAVALAAVIFVATPAHAEDRVQPVQSSRMAPGAGLRDDTINRHVGFFIRPELGGGYLSSTVGDTTISGGAGMLGVVIGGAISENLVLAGHYYGVGISNPQLSQPGQSSTTLDNSSLTMWGIGPNLTYYFMPVNMYASATVALTRLNGTTGNLTVDSDYGIGTRLSLGKEWWASEHWGLGLAGHFSYSANNQSGTTNPQTISTWGLGLSFSATYN